jgi:hypothetical protein
MNEEFIGLEEIADYCYLYEAFYYIMLNIVPKKYKVNSAGIDIRMLYSEEVEKINDCTTVDFIEDTLLEEIYRITSQQDDKFNKQVVFLEEIKFYEILDLRIQELGESSIERVEIEAKKHSFQNPYSTTKIRKKICQYLFMPQSSREKIKQILQATLLENEYNAETKNTSMKFINIGVSAKKDRAKSFLDAIFYEEILEAEKTKTVLMLLNFIESKKVEIGLTKVQKSESNLNFIPKNITQSINFEKLKTKIFKQNTNILVNFNSLKLAHSEFFKSKSRSFTKITNGIQHLMIKDNSLEYSKGGANSYGNTREIRSKAKEIGLRILRDQNRPQPINGKHFARQIAEDLEITESKLVMEYKKVLENKDQGVDWIEDGVYAWCKEIFQTHFSKNKS